MLKLGVLVSGGGTNLQAVLDAIDSGKITNARVGLVISNNPGAYALKRKQRGFPGYVSLRRIMKTEKNFIKRFLPNFRRTILTWWCWPVILWRSLR